MTTDHATQPRLQMLKGDILCRSFELDRESTTLGRDPACDIVLGRRTVSAEHARIIRRSSSYFLEDLESAGGTRINGRTPAGPVRLRDGDLIQIADCLFRFSGSLIEVREEDESRSAILGLLEATEASGEDLAGAQPEAKLRALLEIGHELADTRDLKGVLDNVLEALFRIFPQAQRGFVLLKGDGAVELVLRAYRTRHSDPADLIISRTIFNHVLGEGKGVLSLDVLSDRRFCASRSAQVARIRTLMCVPLWNHERALVGILQIDTQDVQARFCPEDLELLVAVAGPVSVAVDNARLLDEARREKRRLELLADAGAVLSVSFDDEAALGRLARLVVPQLADVCLIDLGTSDELASRVACAYAETLELPQVEDLARRFRPESDSLHPILRVLRTGNPELNNESDEPGRTAAALLRDGEPPQPISSLFVPLVARARTLGVLSLIRTRPDRRYGPADLALAEELARRAALAVDNARLYHESQAASRAKDRILAVLGHELRTPLTPILAAVSARLEHESDPEVARELEMIRRNIGLEARLIDDLLDISRIERGRLHLELEVVDVHEVVQKTVEICRDELLVAGLELALDLAAPHHHVKGDHARLMQIAWNLVHNAAKFTPAGGRLTIRTSNPDDSPAGAATGAGRLAVELQDTGQGIEPEMLPRIFEPFEQGRTASNPRSTGLGLGLSICRSLAVAHGGSLEASSPGPGLGSTFRLVLEPVAAPLVGNRNAAPTHPPQLRRRLKILLVEDNRDTLHFLALVLGHRGHQVRKAKNLAEARASVSSDLDIVISDIELPDGTGMELMRELATNHRLPGIAMSGFGSEEDVRFSREAGFAAHLTKPIDVARLEAAIEQLV
jgi:signal transduction histidine kinase